jgi:hypothetical protein
MEGERMEEWILQSHSTIDEPFSESGAMQQQRRDVDTESESERSRPLHRIRL